ELSIVEVVTQFTRRYPNVRLELDLSPRRVDLIAERFDVALRAASQLPDDSALVARRITTQYNNLYANPDYLKRNGTPTLPSDLLEHTGLILVTSGGEQQQWRLSNGKDYWEGLPLNILAANSLGLQQELAAKGLGIVALSERFAQPLIEAGRLARVLPGWSLPDTMIWCVTPGRRLLPQRTLAFVELLREVLAEA